MDRSCRQDSSCRVEKCAGVRAVEEVPMVALGDDLTFVYCLVADVDFDWIRWRNAIVCRKVTEHCVVVNERWKWEHAKR